MDTGSLLIFGGCRWKVLAVDARAKVIELARSSGGRPPSFTGSGGQIGDQVRQEMLTVYTTDYVPAYLDAKAIQLLAEGRANFTRFRLDANPVLKWGADTLIFPWCGDRILSTITAALTLADANAAPDGVCLTITGTTPAEAVAQLRALATSDLDPLALAACVKNKIAEKYDDLLSDELLDIAYAARSLDVDGAHDALTRLLAHVTNSAISPRLTT